MSKTLAKGIFYFVAVALILWTSSLTYSFVSGALPNAHWIIPLLALIVFDVGMISWMYVFLSHAEGAVQRSTAIALCGFDLIGVILMVIAEIMMGGQTIAAVPARLGDAAIWGIAVWTAVNVAGVVIFHLGDPESRKAMAFQSQKDAIWDGAMKDLEQRRIGMSKQLSAELGDRLFTELLSELAVDVNNNNVPDALERGPVISKSGVGGNDGRMTHDEVLAYIMSNPEAMRQITERAQRSEGQGGGNGAARPNFTSRPSSGSSGR
jgi:hypothetical protein